MLPDALATPPVIDLHFEAPGPQRRWTVGLRAILAIPHFIWLYILMWVAEIATAVGWIAALFTGHLPKGIAEFTTKVLMYAARVLAYAQFLLTDRYPPFSLEPDDEYPVELEVPPPGRLNRAAVLFRLILLVPGSIVATVVMAGVAPILVVAWLVTVITGRTPRPMVEAFTAILRYALRLYGFAALLTSEQPKRLFGDRPAPDTDAATLLPPAADPVATPPAPPVTMTGTAPRVSRLVPSKAGRRLIVLAVVLGALFYAGGFIVAVVSSDQFASAQDEFIRIENDTADESGAYARDIQSCALDGGLPCLRDANARLADAIGDFRHELREIDFPQNAIGAAHSLDDATARFEAALRGLASAPDEATYQARFGEVQAAGAEVSAAELALARALNVELR